MIHIFWTQNRSESYLPRYADILPYHTNQIGVLNDVSKRGTYMDVYFSYIAVIIFEPLNRKFHISLPDSSEFHMTEL